MSLTQFAAEKLKVMTSEYAIEDAGHFSEEPVVSLYCRTADGERRTVDIEGFYPHFYISTDAYEENEDTLLNESAIRHIEIPSSMMDMRRRSNAAVKTLDEEWADLHENEVVRVYTVVPGDTPDLRDWFHKNDYETYEADVFFTDRFMVSQDIYMGIEVPSGEERVTIDDVSPCEAPDVKPRMCTVDIEVLTDGEFPEPTEASQPVTAITAHDSYDDEHVAWILESDEWDEQPEWDFGQVNTYDGVLDLECEVRVYQKEAEMLGDFNHWVIDKDPDIMTGWNSSRNDRGNGFDYPYLINRCLNINEWSVRDLAQDEDTVFVSQRGSAVVNGRELMDMMQAYMKTQIHEKRSYALDYIAEEEVGSGKDDVEDLDEAWKHTPNEFLKYNVRDTLLVVEIERVKGVLDMYDHIRSIAGASYTEIADSNIGIIDILYLREAKSKNIVLPTSTKPDVQHYWGAWVANPKAGLHRNVVYPDLSSLYPNLFRDMNASPETIIGFADDLEASEYSEDDCHRIYVDPRDEEVKKDADDPQREALYVLKPEVQQSFVREVIQSLIDMKYEYKKDEYADEAYAAVKRITNSVYGCMGDSKSYGAGFRLFDWRIAEAITLAGRDVIQHTADTFSEHVENELGYEDSPIVAGDTDSCVSSIKAADGTYTNGNISREEAEDLIIEHPDLDPSEEPVDTPLHETLVAAIKAADYVDSTYDEYMDERFWIQDNNMAVEIESYSETAFFMPVKKRYAQWIRWDEGDYEDEVEYKGFELVRSDSAEMTGRVQKEVLDTLLKADDPKPEIRKFIKATYDEFVAGDVSLDEIGKPMSINKKLSEYGYTMPNGTEVRPQPHVRGAKYATQYIDGENISSGSKPLMYYVEAIRDPDLPEVYSADTAEDEDQVDALSVDDPENIPSTVRIDYEKMVDKVLKGPIEPIFEAMGWGWSDMTSDGSQSSLASYM